MVSRLRGRLAPYFLVLPGGLWLLLFFVLPMIAMLALSAQTGDVVNGWTFNGDWWHTYTDDDHRRADALLDQMGVGPVGSHPFGTLSSGERQRVQLARTLMGEPGLVLLDEPMAGLDIAGREELVAALADFAREPSTPPVVLVTHHVDEIPPGFTHALLLRDGRARFQGPLADALTADHLTTTFGLPLTVEHRPTPNGDRWLAWPSP